MGRLLKRVPLDFSWPLDTRWEGYLNNLPAGHACDECADGRGHSSGSSPFALDLNQKWYGFNGEYDPVADGKVPFEPTHPRIVAFATRQLKNSPHFYGESTEALARECVRLCKLWNTGMAHFLEQEDVDALVEAGRLMDFTHTWTPREDDGKGGWTGGWQEKVPPYRPTAQEVNDWSLGGMGHDAINSWVVIRARCERAGLSARCSTCDGSGVIWDSPEQEAAYEAWEPTQPPVGDGWQLWENTTEGAPITPVFDTPEKLAKHLARSSYAAGLTYEGWMKFILGDGWAMSGVIQKYADGSSVSLTGVQAMVLHSAEEDGTPFDDLFTEVDR